MAEGTFDNLFEGAAAVEVPADSAADVARKEADAAERKAFEQAAIAKFNQDIAADDTLAKAVGAKSGDIEVVAVFETDLDPRGRGLIAGPNKMANGKQERVVVARPVGARIRNNGTTAITYPTGVYSQGADGKWVEDRITKTLAPGEEADLKYLWLAALLTRPEYSYSVANGKMVLRNAYKSDVDVLEKLAGFYFKFADESGHKIHDEDVTIYLDAGDGKSIKPEFNATFGYLNNPKEAKARAQRAKKAEISTQAAIANVFADELKKLGL